MPGRRHIPDQVIISRIAACIPEDVDVPISIGRELMEDIAQAGQAGQAGQTTQTTQAGQTNQAGQVGQTNQANQNTNQIAKQAATDFAAADRAAGVVKEKLQALIKNGTLTPDMKEKFKQFIKSLAVSMTTGK